MSIRIGLELWQTVCGEEGIDAVVDQYDPAPPDGWPMWMDREIQKADFVALVCTETYLRRVEAREEPHNGRGVLWEVKLIYNLVYEADTAVQIIPILLEGGMPSYVPRPLRGLAFYQVNTNEGYEDFYRRLTRQPRHEKPALGKLKTLPAIAPQSYPASLEVRTEQKRPTSLDQRNRLQMLKRVRLDWIDGVLKQSLYKVVRIELGLEAKTDAVEQPLNAIVQVPDQPPSSLPRGTTISQVFDDHADALLILGAPGTGKTTLLLELAEQLLDRAEQDESNPIPVVFNLSSWAARRQPLVQWLVAELNERSDVPKRIAQRWVENEEIMPLLDGLDEVAVDHRQACVEAINNFRRDHGLLPVAVCSRTADYEALGTKIRLRNAVVVQPLTRSQVQDYLERIGEPLRTLRAAFEEDPSLWEVLETPLMLWVAMLAYRDAALESSKEDSFEQRRRQLFADFVDAMFKRRAAEARDTSKQIIRWLSWLASALTRNNQTVFYLENLNVGWLPTRTQRWLSRIGTVVASGLTFGLFYLILGLVYGLIGYSIDSNFVSDLKEWLCIGMIFGLIDTFAEPRPVETIRVSLTDMSSRLRRATRVGLIFGLALELAILGLNWLVVPLVHEMFGGHASARQVLVEAVPGLIVGLIVGLVVGLIALLSGEAVETRTSPNQGTRYSVKIALAAVLIGWLVFVLIGGRIVGWQLYDTLSWGLMCALILGLIGGGLFSVRHFVLRLVIWMNRSAPLNYVRFLDYAVERLFLRKVGGGYIFVHRMLLEYFTSVSAAYGPTRTAVTINDSRPSLS